MGLIVDASALVAILLEEPSFEHYIQKLQSVEEAWISPINLWEAKARLSRETKGPETVEALVNSLNIQVAVISARTEELAFGAFSRFGGRPSRLNLGDCFAYALAKEKSLPLLYKGNDFESTDIDAA